MRVPELLHGILEELIDDELKTFQWYCTIEILVSCKPFPKSHLEKASRTVTASKLTERYGEELAVDLTTEIVKKMGRIDLADKLKKACAGERRPASTSTSSSAQSPPAAAPTAPAAPAAGMSAQQGAVIIAPTLNSGTTGPWTVNIHRS